MSAPQLIDRLTKPKQTGRGSWVACCPAHEDKSPSLTVRETDDGRVLMHCFAGCEVEEILKAVGLEFDALFPPRTSNMALGRVRRPFPAADVLECLSHEALVVLIACRAAIQGKPFDVNRLSVAIQRIEEGRELANG